MNGPLKWHGGKHYLANRIIELMPARDALDSWLHYVEPYAGGLAVLLANDPAGISEVVNDINGDLVNFWRVLRDDRFLEFKRQVEAVPMSRSDWAAESVKLSAEFSGNNVGRAVAFFVCCRQSLAGRMKDFTSITRTRTRRGMNGNVSEWLSAVAGLADVHARLRRLLIENKPALEIIRREDGPKTLFYLDPPYMHETRVSKAAYQHEMSEQDHADLLSLLAGIRGRFLLSGYRSELYDRSAEAAGWERHDFELPNNSAGGTEKRRMVECVWTNY